MSRLRTTFVSLVLLGACGAPAEDVPRVAAPVVDEVAPAAELLPNAVSPDDGLLAGGQPTVDQLTALREAGYLTVVTLRTEGESGAGQEEVEALGMTHVRLPINGGEGLTKENALAFAALLDSVERPAVVHCGSGNRVGAMFALKAYYSDGLGAEEAIAYGLDAGMTGLESSVREQLTAAASP